MNYPKSIVDYYIKKINKEIPVSGVLLFGSFAYGKPTKDSDVDLVVLSDAFRKMDFDERLDWLIERRDKKTYGIAMDIIGYTPSEFRDIEKHSAIMVVAKKRGKWIYQKWVYQRNGFSVDNFS